MLRERETSSNKSKSTPLKALLESKSVRTVNYRYMPVRMSSAIFLSISSHIMTGAKLNWKGLKRLFLFRKLDNCWWTSFSKIFDRKRRIEIGSFLPFDFPVSQGTFLEWNDISVFPGRVENTGFGNDGIYEYSNYNVVISLFINFLGHTYSQRSLNSVVTLCIE